MLPDVPLGPPRFPVVADLDSRLLALAAVKMEGQQNLNLTTTETVQQLHSLPSSNSTTASHELSRLAKQLKTKRLELAVLQGMIANKSIVGFNGPERSWFSEPPVKAIAKLTEMVEKKKSEILGLTKQQSAKVNNSNVDVRSDGVNNDRGTTLRAGNN